MELKYLQTFKTIIESGSFAAAARALDYTQSTITFQMQQLETDLEIQLFERIGRKMHVTQAGKDLIPYVDAVLMSAQRLENFGKSYHELTGRLRVTCAESLLIYRMQPVIRAFRETAPNVHLSLQTKSWYDNRIEVQQGTTDLGIHYDVGGYSSSVKVERFREEPFVLAGSGARDGSHLNFITEGSHNPITLIAVDTNNIMHNRLIDYLGRRHITVDMNLEMTGTEVVKRCVMSGLGITFLPAFTVEEEIADGRIRIYETELKRPSIAVVCSYHKNKYVTPAMELFLNLMRDTF